MTLATKNNAIIVKDGKLAADCGCCGDWYCDGGNSPCACLSTQSASDSVAVLQRTSVVLSISSSNFLIHKSWQYNGNTWYGSLSMQAAFLNGTHTFSAASNATIKTYGLPSLATLDGGKLLPVDHTCPILVADAVTGRGGAGAMSVSVIAGVLGFDPNPERVSVSFPTAISTFATTKADCFLNPGDPFPSHPDGTPAAGTGSVDGASFRFADSCIIGSSPPSQGRYGVSFFQYGDVFSASGRCYSSQATALQWTLFSNRDRYAQFPVSIHPVSEFFGVPSDGPQTIVKNEGSLVVNSIDLAVS